MSCWLTHCDTAHSPSDSLRSFISQLLKESVNQHPDFCTLCADMSNKAAAPVVRIDADCESMYKQGEKKEHILSEECLTVLAQGIDRPPSYTRPILHPTFFGIYSTCLRGISLVNYDKCSNWLSHLGSEVSSDAFHGHAMQELMAGMNRRGWLLMTH